ncbi:helix-turn-helix domain-containing protein [Microbispora rosea]|uniref:helix-turn-helix domain-containing protein n=1 Tax=Microbispora rosea TaxID=58117 RepID=UPI003798A4CD
MTITMTRQKFSGKALRQARDARRMPDGRKMTAAQLAEATGISVDTIRDYEGGRYAPNADRLVALARALGVPMESLFAEVDETEEDNT